MFKKVIIHDLLVPEDKKTEKRKKQKKTQMRQIQKK
jgi:hypothetical protein